MTKQSEKKQLHADFNHQSSAVHRRLFYHLMQPTIAMSAATYPQVTADNDPNI